MPTSTTLKLPEKLKRRIARVAKSAGETPHAWMIEALALHTTLAEKRKILVADALAAAQEVDSMGDAYEAGAAHQYLQARATGRKLKRPRPVQW